MFFRTFQKLKSSIDINKAISTTNGGSQIIGMFCNLQNNNINKYYANTIDYKPFKPERALIISEYLVHNQNYTAK